MAYLSSLTVVGFVALATFNPPAAHVAVDISIRPNAIASILDRQVGLHAEFVFTYACQKSRSWKGEGASAGFGAKASATPSPNP